MAQQDRIPILDHADIEAKLRRIGYEIYEKNFAREEIILVGVRERGSYVADAIARTLGEISPLKIQRFRASEHRDTGKVAVELSDATHFLKGKTVIVADDVLYSGGTMLDTIASIWPYAPASIQVAVLINRGHRSFPVTPDFVGLELATTRLQHVYVVVSSDGSSASAHLSSNPTEQG